jgi:hypothetical protein
MDCHELLLNYFLILELKKRSSKVNSIIVFLLLHYLFLFFTIGIKEQFQSKLYLFSFYYYFINFYIAWNPQNGRQFFENYAKDHVFDPHIPENWYSITAKSILSNLVFSHIIIQ